MSGTRAKFGPIPFRAVRADLSGLDLRVLTCVAAHDHMSLVRGKGQGCRASNLRMKEMIGCDYSRLSTSLSRLVRLGFLLRENLGRHTVYRVVYTDEDGLLFGKASSRPEAVPKTGSAVPKAASDMLPNSGVTVCQHTSENLGNQPKPASQYIPLNGERYSVETGEYSSSEEAHLAARRLGRPEDCTNVGGQLARLERALNAGEEIDDPLSWYQWLDSAACEDPNEANRYRALRLSEELSDELLDQMDDHDYDRARSGGA